MTEKQDAPQDDKQVVFLRGPSHGAEAGAKRVVTAKEAESLVARGLARYPKNKG